MTAIALPHGSSPNWPFAGSVYGVRLATSREYRYVGLTTKTVSWRRMTHWKAAAVGKKTPFADWLRMHSDRESVYFESLEIVASADLEDLGRAEARWITVLRSQGHRLLNLTDGGLGPRGYVWTDEQRQAAGLRSRGRKHPNPLRGADNPMWGRHHTDEQRALWSAQRRGMNTGASNPNFGKFGSDHPSFGREVSSETRERLSLQKRGELNPNFGKTASAETRAKMSAARKGRPMPSSVRSAHTRHHTNKGVFSATCRHCLIDRGIESTEGSHDD